MQVSCEEGFPHPFLNSEMSSLVAPSITGGALEEVQSGPRAPLGKCLTFGNGLSRNHAWVYFGDLL